MGVQGESAEAEGEVVRGWEDRDWNILGGVRSTGERTKRLV